MLNRKINLMRHSVQIKISLMRLLNELRIMELPAFQREEMLTLSSLDYTQDNQRSKDSSNLSHLAQTWTI
jgi:hypothetical protein